VSKVNFQELILRLHTFWASKGCLIWQPYSEKVGAGTMNPATVISVLGPEPWNVAYTEPSYRPDDGRFGENPNRMQMHTQYQVILKPDPGNPQEIYLESLRAIGINTDEHDIRFVEDNWESPALGAWGLGWEVWLNGLEITQFTYFQQASSKVLDLPAVEITYGLERIAIFLQGVRQVWDLDFDGRLTYGEVLLQPEIDHCKYDFDEANVERLTQMYALYEAEARSAIAAGLVVPSHDYVLRCSHTFNVLDARGAIGVTERAKYFAKMRDLSKQVAELYLGQREAKGFPLTAKLPARVEPVCPEISPRLSAPADFVFEVGVEELPPDELRSVIEQWQAKIPKLLEEHRLGHESVWVSGTPRRLVAVVKGLAAGQEDRTVEVKGPPANKAYDAEGKPTQTALGFIKSQRIALEDLQVRTEGDRSYVVAKKSEPGRSAAEVLAGCLDTLITGVKFRKVMRWDHTGSAFSRPVRWILALHGEQVVPVKFGALVSGRVTRGPRPAGSPDLTLPNASGYLELLKGQGVIVDRDERRKKVSELVAAQAATVGGQVPPEEALLDEVTDLVEVPVAVLGRFEEERLTLPAPVLTTVMKKHQRYFPVQKASGELINAFVAVSNGQRGDMSLVRQGNEDVLRARYADASYFVKSDLGKPLADNLERLKTLTFQEKLGSMYDKSQRVEKLSASVAEAMGLSQDETRDLQRAAQLCKADLVSSMVVEMTSLQGILGELYAVSTGENAAVGKALREHYLPRYAGDADPESKVGQALSIADRLDSLAGLFACGLKPTGSADPYGLRRTAVGLVSLLVHGKIHLDLKRFLELAAELQPVKGGATADVLAFVGDRLSVWLRDQGLGHDVVEAAVAERGSDPYGAYLTAKALSDAVAGSDWNEILTAYARCKRITRDLGEEYALSEAHYTEPSAKELYEAYQKHRLPSNGSRPGAEELLAALRQLTPSINSFFDAILVMAEDQQVRQARLALVQRIAELPKGIADLSKLQGF